MRHFSLLSSLLWMACRSDDSVKILNANPEITIVSHDSNSLIREGELNRFRAQVSDTNHDPEELEVAWYSGATQLCDWGMPTAGESLCEATLTEDSNLIAEVRIQRVPQGRQHSSWSLSRPRAPTVAGKHPAVLEHTTAMSLLSICNSG